MTALFAIDYSAGPNWLEGKSTFEQPLQAHLAYMTELSYRGVLLLGGPFTDTSGGLGVVMAASQEEADGIAAQDPAVQSQLLHAVVHPWKVMLTGRAALAAWTQAACGLSVVDC
jgi:uncharacterized protein YciI